MSNKPDGRKYNGGVRAGAGRPPKPEEIKMLEKLTADNFTDEAIAVLQDKVRGGNVECLKLWFSYVYGTPKQKIETESNITVSSIDLKDIISFDDLPTDDIDFDDL